MSNQMELKFDGMEEYMKRLNDMGKGIKNVTENALKASVKKATPGIKDAIAPHRLTGATEGSIRDVAEIDWYGNIAVAYYGFSISSGGLASIFLMYGTYGGPDVKPDQKLYDSIFGSKVRRDVKKVQKEVFIKGIIRK